MKILEINKFLYPRGGADKHFLDVVEMLKKESHQVAIFSMQHPNNFKSRWGKYFVSYVGYNKGDSNFWEKLKGISRMFYSFEARKKINKLLDDFQPEIVHIHNVYYQLSPCILFEIKKRNIPIVMTVHDYKLINPNHSLFLNGKFYDRCKKGKFYQCVLDKCVKNSYFKSLLATVESYWHYFLGTFEKNIDFYIVPSEFVKEILVERGINGKKIITLPHFAKKHKVSSIEKPVRGNAIYFGRISKEKGVDTLIDIFTKLKMPLYLAGSIEGDFNIAVNSYIRYLGFLNQKELKEKILESSLVASGSKLPETFGLIALEAISLGKPFIGFNFGAFKEIVENGKEGFLCENKEEFKRLIEEVLRDNQLREALSKNALKKSEKFSYEKYYLKLLSIFNSFSAS